MNHWDYNVEELSLNFRLSDVQCALGINQLKYLNISIKKKKKISNFYDKKLTNYKNFYFIKHKKKLQFILSPLFHKV